MKPFKPLLIILAAISTCAQPLVAAPLAYNPGDLFMGFRASGGTGVNTDYLINIGQASVYRDAAPGTFNIAVGSIGADLAALYGATWFNRADLFWGIVGSPANFTVGLDPTNTLYATTPQAAGTPTNPPATPASNSTQAGPAGRISGLATQYTLTGDSANGVSPASNPAGLRQATSDSNSWAFFMGGTQTFTGNSFSYFGNGIESNFGAGSAGAALDLFRITKTPGGVASNEGTFRISDSGVVSFNAVPEPVTGALLVIGSTVFGLFHRPRRPATT